MWMPHPLKAHRRSRLLEATSIADTPHQTRSAVLASTGMNWSIPPASWAVRVVGKPGAWVWGVAEAEASATTCRAGPSLR